MRKASGFTLIELMITVAVIAILSAIAYPSYLGQVQKAKRSAAQQFMLEVSLAEEQYILDNVGAGYAGTLATLGMSTPAEVGDNYTITIDNTTPSPGYTITATPVAGSQMAGTGTLTIDSRGNKTPPNLW